MSSNQFYNTTNSGSHSLANMPSTASKKVFNSGGAGVSNLINTKPQMGFSNAMGSMGKHNGIGKFYGADGTTGISAIDASMPATPAATTSTAAATPASTTISIPAPLGMNTPSLLLLGAGVLIGYFIAKGND